MYSSYKDNKMNIEMYFVPILLVMLFGYARGQDANCDFMQNAQVGTKYYIYNREYPNRYTAPARCRWIVRCPTGYNCRLDCSVELPQSPSCTGDRLLVSRTGDPSLVSADTYCGSGNFTAVSVGQDISVGLVVTQNTAQGRFICELSSQRQTSSESCQCGYQRQDRIVGGTETRPNEFPMMAGIVYIDEVEIRCGAVIISNTVVVSAAHCVISKPLNELGVIVGEHDTSTGADSNATQAYRVLSKLTHPLYNESNYDYDVAVVKIIGRMIFSALVGPACLPFKFANNDFAGSTVTVLGWGTLAPGGVRSRVLRKVDLNVITQNSCRQFSGFESVTPRQMCTYTRGKDACQDDSGGPLLYRDSSNGLLYHIGIISFGRFCASSTPGINTRVSAVLSWIVSNAPDTYCSK